MFRSSLCTSYEFLHHGTIIQTLGSDRRRRAWGRPAPTELERGTRDDPIVLDPPGKFQCIVEAAIF